MEYLAKQEVMEYLDGYRKELMLQGKDGNTINTIMKTLNGMYTYRPTIQATWLKKRDVLQCSRCGFKTLVYKNSKYCPECGRLMTNGSTNDQKRL